MKRRRIIVAATLLLVVGGFVAWIGGGQRGDRLRYEAAVRALAEQGQLEQLFGPPVPETEAEQKRLDELTRKIAGTLPPTDVLQRVGPNLYLPAWRGLGLGDPTNAPMDWTKAARQVDAVSEELAEIRKILAMDRPRSWLPRTNWNEGFAARFVPRRDRAFHLVAVGLVSFQRDRSADGLAMVRAVWAESRRFRRDGIMVDLTIRSRIAVHALGLVAGSVGQAEIGESDLKAIQEMLLEADWIGELPFAAATERAMIVQLAEAVRNLSIREKRVFFFDDGGGWKEDLDSFLMGELRSGYPEALVLLNLMNRLVADVSSGIGSPEYLRRLPARPSIVPRPGNAAGFFTPLLNDYKLETLDRLFHIECQRRMAVLRIAAERFRLQHGRYPQRAEDLVPEFLAAVPLDPLDGQPVRYRIGQNGKPFLYCVGLDGVDQGGAGDALDDSGSSPDWPWPQIATTSAEEVAP